MFEIGGKKIPSSLAELVAPERTALLVWDMEYAIAPNAFNYKELVPQLQELSALARRIGVPVFYSLQTGFDPLREEAGVWVRIRMKRGKAADPRPRLNEKDDPDHTRVGEELNHQPHDVAV